MTKYQAVKTIGQRKSSPIKRRKEAVVLPSNPLPPSEVFKCSKCADNAGIVFKNREEFYAHLLECGGEVDWDVSKKKSKKKKKSLLKRTNSTEVRIYDTPGRFYFFLFQNELDI